MKALNHKKARRRTCYDRARKRWLEARRAQARNPAAAIAMQLLGVFGFALGRMPITTPMPTLHVAPTMSPRQEERRETARRLGIPTRYLDSVLSQGRVPYSVLFNHIRPGGATRRDALTELRKRIPAEALEWFDHVEKQELWSDLSRCFRPNEEEESTNVRFLQSTLAWVERGQIHQEYSLSAGLNEKTTHPNDDPDGRAP